MASKFKKLVKKLTPNPKKLTPKFVQKSEILTKLGNASIAQRIVKQNSAIARAPNWKPATIRPILREQHELQTTPFSKTSEMIIRRNQLPVGDPERDRLTAQINAKTLRRGKLGIAVGGTVVGGAAGAAIKAGGAAVTRDNPTPDQAPGQMVDTWPDPRFYPSVQEQMYSRSPSGAPLAQRRSLTASAPNGGGPLSKVVNVLWQILVPKRA